MIRAHNIVTNSVSLTSRRRPSLTAAQRTFRFHRHDDIAAEVFYHILYLPLHLRAHVRNDETTNPQRDRFAVGGLVIQVRHQWFPTAIAQGQVFEAQGTKRGNEFLPGIRTVLVWLKEAFG